MILFRSYSEARRARNYQILYKIQQDDRRIGDAYYHGRCAVDAGKVESDNGFCILG